jgi:hypothetical protein
MGDSVREGDRRNAEQVEAVAKALAKMKGDVAQIFEDLAHVSCRVTDFQTQQPQV